MRNWRERDRQERPRTHLCSCGGGGGGGGVKYDNLERLYGLQADQGERLMNYSNEEVYPRLTNQLQQAENYGSQANQEDVATRAGATSQSALDAQLQNMRDNFASLGIDPSDERSKRREAQMAVAGAGQIAGSETGARDKVRQQGFAMQQDALGMAMGTPTQATAALNSAGNMASQVASGQMANQMANANAYGNIARGAADMYAFGDSKNWFGADGGHVTKQGIDGPHDFADGGYVGGFANGGGVNAWLNQTPPAPPSGGAPQGSSTTQQVLGGAKTLAGTKAGKAFYDESAKVVDDAMVKMGLKQPAALNPAEGDAALANQTIVESGVGNEALGSGVTTTPLEASPAIEGVSTLGEGAVVGTEAAGAAETAAGIAASEAIGTGTVAATEVGAATGAAGAAGLTALGTVVPMVGAGLGVYLIGKDQGWWADGGMAGGRGIQNKRKGGNVQGAGGPKDDRILAHLSDGEFVMPVGTVKKYGLAKLEKMRKEGLQLEHQLGIRRGSRAA